MDHLVYIIESPSSADFLADRREGESLSKMLDLLQVHNLYLVAIDEKAFASALLKVRDDFERHWRASATGLVMPILHISCHAGNDGVILSNGDVISWPDFRSHLESINQNTVMATYGMSPWHVCVSACRGLNAFKSDEANFASPFTALVGSFKDMKWADALVAYTAYYHSLTFREKGGLQAVQTMNQAIGESDLFQVYLGRDFKEYMRKH